MKELLGDKEQLSDADKAELTNRMKEFLPNDKLEFLIRISADVVAAQIPVSLTTSSGLRRATDSVKQDWVRFDLIRHGFQRLSAESVWMRSNQQRISLYSI